MHLRAVVAAVMLCSLAAGPAAAQPPAVPSPPAPPRPNAAAATQGTDIYWMDLSVRGGAVTLGKPVRLTDRPGYDNQPLFSPDGKSIYYTAIDADGQADIQSLRLRQRHDAARRATPESEYSPTPTPDARALSVVRVEANETQRLWRFPRDGARRSCCFPSQACRLPRLVPTRTRWCCSCSETRPPCGSRTGARQGRGRGRRDRALPAQGPGQERGQLRAKVARGEWWLSKSWTSGRARPPASSARRRASEDYAWLPDGAAAGGRRATPAGAARSRRAPWREVATFDEPGLQASAAWP